MPTTTTYLKDHPPPRKQDGQLYSLKSYCYRHNPKFNNALVRQESMNNLQKSLEELPPSDQEAISNIWAMFASSPPVQRRVILQGLLAQCCFPQLSFISSVANDMMRIDILSALPNEICFRILIYLDAASLCRAAQVSNHWKKLADDETVWKTLCRQHIDRKCTKCGWGLPLLERNRLRAATKQRSPQSPHIGEDLAFSREIPSLAGSKRSVSEGPGEVAQCTIKQPCLTVPWKHVYSERCKIEQNWRRGRYETKILKGHTKAIMCLQFDDNTLITGSFDRTIRVWNVKTGVLLRTLKGHDGPVSCLGFDDEKLFSGGLDGSVRLWDYRSGRCRKTLPRFADGVSCLHFEESILATGFADGTVRIWNFITQSLDALICHADFITCVRVKSKPKVLFSASHDTTVKLWSLETHSCIRAFLGHIGQVQSLVLHSFPAFEIEDNESDYTTDSVVSSETLPKHLLTSSMDNTIRLWNVDTGQCKTTLFGHVEGVWDIAADNFRLVSCSNDCLVKVWDLYKGKCEHTLAGHSGPVTCVGLGDAMVVSAGEDGDVRIWDFGISR
ncbi:putative E3 ubiquitin ligase complex SCF subunit sconB [Neolecta irregularis DAH-3]|uniref:Putative E3 ubiquitin ligase complex SCF subunit sconB n=1 Tax=Neolecta irregularis (strain DAH-3) TaxID=1198029 RepID=A0A1U7LRX2_NEOID|nr:putative E3 ubiquitin ligase complex SCF subunit sconB [Neolecta irregularis DAH-3]|eukprot:OLL25415.1 putative E3 ubiquitin ligase complex SCF subunit sconB [Neolecta irregularis DAH-3]